MSDRKNKNSLSSESRETKNAAYAKVNAVKGISRVKNAAYARVQQAKDFSKSLSKIPVKRKNIDPKTSDTYVDYNRIDQKSKDIKDGSKVPGEPTENKSKQAANSDVNRSSISNSKLPQSVSSTTNESKNVKNLNLETKPSEKVNENNAKALSSQPEVSEEKSALLSQSEAKTSASAPNPSTFSAGNLYEDLERLEGGGSNADDSMFTSTDGITSDSMFTSADKITDSIFKNTKNEFDGQLSNNDGTGGGDQTKNTEGKDIVQSRSLQKMSTSSWEDVGDRNGGFNENENKRISSGSSEGELIEFDENHSAPPLVEPLVEAIVGKKKEADDNAAPLVKLHADIVGKDEEKNTEEKEMEENKNVPPLVSLHTTIVGQDDGKNSFYDMIFSEWMRSTLLLSPFVITTLVSIGSCIIRKNK